MINEKRIKQIEKLLNKEKIINYELLQFSFDIACIKIQISNKKKFIVKFYINKNNFFNSIKSEARNLLYLNDKFEFFPKIIKSNNHYLIIQYFENDKNKPKKNLDFLESIVKIHSVSNKLYGFDFNTQIGAIEMVNKYEETVLVETSETA